VVQALLIAAYGHAIHYDLRARDERASSEARKRAALPVSRPSPAKPSGIRSDEATAMRSVRFTRGLIRLDE
jgi:hypothetical protein